MAIPASNSSEYYKFSMRNLKTLLFELNLLNAMSSLVLLEL